MPTLKRILIIEDEKPLANALKLKLTHAGYEVEVASNGEEGVEKLTSKSFNLALLDLVMPKLDGFGVLEQLKAKNIKVPVIILSNLSQEEDVAKAKSLGAKDFFIKSDTPLAEVIDLVQKNLK